ncbi:MAG TPA: hypothetical protein VHT53_07435 [Candidatus Elarobacter sp.]|nr:hypothetical protein [Candidatus Elarobacter sp.]
MPILRERCQFENTIYRYVFPFGTARAVRRAALRAPDRFTKRAGSGKRSRFAPGDWVRIKDAARIGETLDERGCLRGLSFTREQWGFCGGTYRVASVVRRIMTDTGRMRAIARTVALDGVTCDGPSRDGGCGRACPLLFRDEWLEESSAELTAPEPLERFARVRSLEEIARTLDASGRRDGVLFTSAMRRFAGLRLPIHKRVLPVAATWWRRAGGEWYVLGGARCLGESLGADGPCDRGCGLLWHRDWLELDG